MRKINIEAEHNELILENSHGDKVIIPANKRNWVKTKLKDQCYDCIDQLVETLPTLQQYAGDGSLIPADSAISMLDANTNNATDYTLNSPEYVSAYNSGNMATYNKDKDSYDMVYPLSEVKISAERKYPESVRRQLDYIKNNVKESQNYALIDKKGNQIYYFDSGNNYLSHENVITGQNNSDEDYSISMRDWMNMPENKKKTHDDYFDYLGEYENRVTPSGHFTISSLRDDITANPATWRGKIYNVFKDLVSLDKLGTRNADIVESRKKSYGSQNKLFTLKDDQGVYSSKAIHGTDSPNRENALNNATGSNPRSLDLSNGCINVGDNSKCFDYLSKNSSVYLLPEHTDDIIQPNVKYVPQSNLIKKSKSQIIDVLKRKGLNYDDDMVNFMTSVYGKESSFGTNKLIPIQDKLPIFKSDGPFQINPDSKFKKHLPKNYDGSFDAQVESVYNFYNHHKDNTPKEKYQIYNTGRIRSVDHTNVVGFTKIYDRVSKIK